MKPIKKFQTAGIAGAVATIAIAVARQYGIEMTQEVASAIGVLVAIATGYMWRDSLVEDGRLWRSFAASEKKVEAQGDPVTE
jgi:putative flippase GtrA